MGLYNSAGHIEHKFLSIKDGKIFLKDSKIGFDCFEGKLKKIKTRKATFQNEEKEMLDLYFIDDEMARFVVSTTKNSGVARSILNNLANIKETNIDEGRLRIHTYQKDSNYTKLQLFYQDRKLDWEYSDWNNKESDSKFFDIALACINNKLSDNDQNKP